MANQGWFMAALFLCGHRITAAYISKLWKTPH